MKKLIAVALMAFATTLSSFGQGSFDFNNGSSTVQVPIFAADGTTPLTGGLADFVWRPVGSSDAFQAFSSAAVPVAVGQFAPGFFFGGVVTLPVTGSVEVQVRAWTAASGGSWALASANPDGFIGTSSVVTVPLAVGTEQPISLANFGLNSFQMVAVPEPSTFALAGLGAAALLVFRRRK